MLHLLAALPLLIWIYLLAARGGFWRVSRQMNPWAGGASGTANRVPVGAGPRVVAVIPARNEAASIGITVTSLLRQQLAPPVREDPPHQGSPPQGPPHEGSLQILVVDDGSTDGTAAAALAAAQAAGAAARLTVVHGAPLASGWTGKLWALQQGVEAAQPHAPDYLLFTDADIEHERDCVAGLIANAEADRRDLVSYMVKLSVDTAAERCLIPAFVFFFMKLYPPRWVASPRYRTAAAAGGCILIRPQALQRLGGLAALRSRIIDDCALARAVKDGGGGIWLGLTQSARSLRRYGSLAEIGSMISRTAFSQLRHSYWLLAATLLGLAVTYIAPPLLLLTRDPVAVALGLAAWILMSVCYLPMVLFYGLSAAWSLCLPAIAAFYAGATVHSAVQYGLGRGGQWKGRAQDLRA